MFEVDTANLEAQLPEIIAELLDGSGAVVIRQAFSPEEIKQARDLIMSYSAEVERESHFVGGSMDKVHLQRRVWNLLNKGEIFEAMVRKARGREDCGSVLG